MKRESIIILSTLFCRLRPMIMHLALVQADLLVYYRTGFEFSPCKFPIQFMSWLLEICPSILKITRQQVFRRLLAESL